MPSREAMIIYARSIANNYKGVQADGSFPSWQTLKAIYDDALEAPINWTIQNEANLKALKAGRWMRKDGVPGGTLDTAAGMSWCGIFATYVLRGIGINVKWRSFVGITPVEPHLKRLGGFGNWNSIAPGDICVRDSFQHHFIVYRREGQMLYSYDGNLDFPIRQNIGEKVTPVNKVHTIFRPLF